MTHEHPELPQDGVGEGEVYWILVAEANSVYPCRGQDIVPLDSFNQQVLSTYCVQRSGLDFGSTSIKETDKNSALVRDERERGCGSSHCSQKHMHTLTSTDTHSLQTHI